MSGGPPTKRSKYMYNGADSDKENTPPTQKQSTPSKTEQRKRKIAVCRHQHSHMHKLPYELAEQIFDNISLMDLYQMSLMSKMMYDYARQYFHYRHRIFNFSELLKGSPGPMHHDNIYLFMFMFTRRFGDLMHTILVPLRMFEPTSEKEIASCIMTFCKNSKTITFIRS